MGAGEGRRDLEVLAATGARRAGRAWRALADLVAQVELHLEAAIEEAEPVLEDLQRQAGEQGPGGPAAVRALALELLIESLAAVGPRAAKARAVASGFYLICLVVLGLTELVIALFLVLEGGRLLAPRLDPGTLFLYVLALQFLLLPAFLRWLREKLLWETYEGVCSDLTGAVAGLRRALE